MRSPMAGYFSLTQIHDAANWNSITLWNPDDLLLLAWGLGYFGMPHVLLRFMAIEDVKKLKLSRRVATVWVVISMFVAVFIGVVGNAMSKVGVIPTLEDPETIIIVVAGVISQHGCAGCYRSRSVLARYSGSDHVHRRFTASGSILQCFSEYSERSIYEGYE